MSDFTTIYQVTSTPGPNAASAMTRGPGGTPVLVVYLDPVTMTLHGEPTAAGTHRFAAFCRELAQEATRLADTIDPPTSAPRHALAAEGGAPNDG